MQYAERDGASIRHIQTLDGAGHVEAHDGIATFTGQPPQTLAFRAQRQNDRRSHGHGFQRLGAF